MIFRMIKEKRIYGNQDVLKTKFVNKKISKEEIYLGLINSRRMDDNIEYDFFMNLLLQIKTNDSD